MDHPDKNKDDNLASSYKLTTEESPRKEDNTLRNEDSVFNNKKDKKSLIKIKGADRKSSNASSYSKKTIQIKNNTNNNIIIHINNQINQGVSNQNIQLNTINQVQDVEIKKDSPKGFVELTIDNKKVEQHKDVNEFKYSERVLEATQNLLMVNISRLIFSKNCATFYISLIILCSILTLMSSLDIFLQFNLMNQIWLFVLEIIIFALIMLDAMGRIYAMKNEYISNCLLIIVDILITILFPVQIIRFASQNSSIISNIIHAIFCMLITIRYVIVYVALKNNFRRQEDVRQNVEEIINFTDVLDDNHKNFENKKFHKMTPSISFIDEETKNKFKDKKQSSPEKEDEFIKTPI